VSYLFILPLISTVSSTCAVEQLSVVNGKTQDIEEWDWIEDHCGCRKNKRQGALERCALSTSRGTDPSSKDGSTSRHVKCALSASGGVLTDCGATAQRTIRAPYTSAVRSGLSGWLTQYRERRCKQGVQGGGDVTIPPLRDSRRAQHSLPNGLTGPAVLPKRERERERLHND